jgi:hypothetical protein
MSEQNLGMNIVVQKENAYNLFSNNLLAKSDFQPIIDTEHVYIFTKDSDNEILDATESYNKKLKDLKEIEQPVRPSVYIKNDYVTNFYFASLTVVGLYIVFRMIKKTK